MFWKQGGKGREQWEADEDEKEEENKREWQLVEGKNMYDLEGEEIN